MFSQKQVEFKEDDLRRPLHIFFLIFMKRKDI